MEINFQNENYGWECPRCRHILSPYMVWCPFCEKETYTTDSTSTEEYHLNNTYELTEAQKDAFKTMYNKLQFSNLNLDKE